MRLAERGLQLLILSRERTLPRVRTTRSASIGQTSLTALEELCRFQVEIDCSLAFP